VKYLSTNREMKALKRGHIDMFKVEEYLLGKRGKTELVNLATLI